MTAAAEKLRQAVAGVIDDWQGGRHVASVDIDELLVRLFRFQVDHIAPYAALTRSRGIDPARVCDWRDIPCAPAELWKLVPMATPAAVARPAAVFETSGTTSGAPGRAYLADTGLYHRAARAVFARFAADQAERLALCWLNLVPNPAERPHSSLGHMVADLCRAATEVYWLLGGDGRPDVEGFATACTQAARTGKPVLVAATSVALHAVCAGLPPEWRVALPPGSRLMDTGGPKGRDSDVDRTAQHAVLTERLGLPAHALIGEFGMTELASQRYEPVWRLADPARRAYVGPPWLRTRVLRVVSGAVPTDDCAVGEIGVVAHLDLANVDTCAFLQTGDLGWLDRDGHLVLQGRLAGAELRGCGLAVAGG
ncbi:MAG: hypothetical protein FJ100_17580 [Deltaproteobacteria bacterium]|nr:hypothetical protein [Deltaproteobacteria bacterium]